MSDRVPTATASFALAIGCRGQCFQHISCSVLCQNSGASTAHFGPARLDDGEVKQTVVLAFGAEDEAGATMKTELATASIRKVKLCRNVSGHPGECSKHYCDGAGLLGALLRSCILAKFERQLE